MKRNNYHELFENIMNSPGIYAGVDDEIKQNRGFSPHFNLRPKGQS